MTKIPQWAMEKAREALAEWRDYGWDSLRYNIARALVAEREVTTMANRTLVFGSGNLVIGTGTYNGVPAVFITPAKYPGEVGASAKRENLVNGELIHGEVVLTFPTVEQAKRVDDALCNADATKAGERAS